MNVSIASYSFHGLLRRGMIDVFGYLESVRYRYHLNAADIWNGMLTSYDDEYLAKVRAALDERELTLANLCVDGAHVWEPDPREREANGRRALENLHAAEVLGAKTVRIDVGGRDEEMTTEQFDFTVARYKEYAQRAYDNGYKVGPENHWGCARVIDNMARLAEAVDHPGFGVLLHFTNWATDIEASDKTAAAWAMHTHFSASVQPMYEAKIQLLDDAGYGGCYSVEHHSGRNEYVRVDWQLATIRRALRDRELED